jgi:DNA mismatch repair protein MutS
VEATDHGRPGQHPEEVPTGDAGVQIGHGGIRAATTPRSVLYERTIDRENEAAEEPSVFRDLNLDQVIDAIVARRDEYDLRPFFYSPLRTVASIEYRQEVLRDLENQGVLEAVRSFAKKMATVRRYISLVGELDYKYNRQGWLLYAAGVYCDAVSSLVGDFGTLDIESRGLRAFFEYLESYAKSDVFTSLASETIKVKTSLSGVKYCLHITGNRFSVRRYEGEKDYAVDILKAFEKFKEQTPASYLTLFSDGPETNHIEAAALNRVARLYPGPFRELENFCAKHSDFLDSTIADFDREVQFYVAYLEFVVGLTLAGMPFCFPKMSEDSKEVYSYEGYDLALANKLVREGSPVVRNDFFLRGRERIFVVNGPNQGGKTTFARTFGQLHYLAALGLSVPGREARLFLFDKILTHFERQENNDDMRSRLEDDLIRIHSVLDESTPRSIIIINELFSSSTLQDGVFLGRRVLEQVIGLDALCVCVTFLDELGSLDKTVSILSTVDPANPERRTFKILRRPPDGLAYADAIAAKYRISYDAVKERISR